MLRWVEKSFIIIGVLAAIIGVGFLAISLSSHYLDQKYADAHQGCFPNQAVHSVTIENGKVSPNHVDALRCDTLTIINHDSVQRMIAFGLHEKHVPYDGIEVKMLGKDGSLTVTLIQVGSFRFHDHLNDAVQGAFSVY
jgi:hypothetical protein